MLTLLWFVIIGQRTQASDNEKRLWQCHRPGWDQPVLSSCKWLITGLWYTPIIVKYIIDVVDVTLVTLMIDSSAIYSYILVLMDDVPTPARQKKM